MSEPVPTIGSITWTDLTVPHADRIRDFYAAVVGWNVTEVDMGGYQDYCMNEPATGKSVAGVCWQRGSNAGLPSVWLVYINVADLEESARRCEAQGGTILRPPTSMGGYGRYCVIQDPAGAVAALFEPSAAPSDTTDSP